jgi:hypothetical protein
MAAKANSQTAEYIDAARARWPGYSISGDGSLAVIYHCAHKIELVAMPMLAQTIVGERCGPYCSHTGNKDGGWHVIRRIELPRPRVPFTMRDWED